MNRIEAEIIAVGTELLDLRRRDTNSEWLTDRLARLGIRVVSKVIVDDDEARIAGRIREALGRVDWVLVSGGLGPTGDDRTREAVARALALPLERDPTAEADLATRFRARKFPFDERQARQADRPRGARWLVNPIGTAAGFVIDAGGSRIAVLPGVPAELQAIFDGELAPLLGAGAAAARRVLKVAGRAESKVDERIRDLYGLPGVRVTVLSSPQSVEVVLQVEDATSAEDAGARLDELDRSVADRLGVDLFGRGDETLAGVVGEMLRARGMTVATAESCTAGLLAGAITAVAGASAWFRGGVVAYHDDVKVEHVGVARATLERHGAVSSEVVRELARGVRERYGADVGIGITGIAGPSGGTPDKPVGLVHVAVEGRSLGAARELRLPGDRESIRRRSVAAALDLLRRSLLEAP